MINHWQTPSGMSRRHFMSHLAGSSAALGASVSLGNAIYANSKNGVVFNGSARDLEGLEEIEGFTVSEVVGTHCDLFPAVGEVERRSST